MNTPRVRCCEVGFHVLNMRTRMPFKYGIASLSALPHLFVTVEAEIDGRRSRGLAAEGLPPKWFTKDPATTFAADLADMLAVIRHAAEAAVAAGEQPSVFGWWLAVQEAQAAWGAGRGFPPLLAGLGTSLVERAAIDAVCRARAASFDGALRSGLLGVRLSAVHDELPEAEVERFLPAAPAGLVGVRHTVGLADPLEEGEIGAEDRIEDGLPQSLEASIGRYGLRYFKVKLCGQPERDLERLRRVSGVLAAAGVREPAWTLDGNEQFGSVEGFRELWERFCGDPAMAAFRRGLLAVEQPFPRGMALSEETGRGLNGWGNRPPMIIDESDGEPGTVRRALERGYAGTSHKNCKGVFRGVASACLLRHREERMAGARFLLTSEDLASVGPVCMLQDLCVAACLGLTHSERNGHHYFRGLSMFPRDIQDTALRVHGDLYERAAAGFATLKIRDGGVATGSVLAAPFGAGVELDARRFTPLEEWSVESLGV